VGVTLCGHVVEFIRHANFPFWSYGRVYSPASQTLRGQVIWSSKFAPLQLHAACSFAIPVAAWHARSTGQRPSLVWQQRQLLGLSHLAYVHLLPIRRACALYSLVCRHV